MKKKAIFCLLLCFVMLTPVVALAAVYPRFGFVVRRVKGDIEENREQILNAFRSAGFSLRSDEDGVMTFRADNFGQKLMLLGEDEIKVSQYGQWIVLDGIRRPGAVPARFVYTHDTQ